MTPAPDSGAILLPVGVAVTLTFCTVIIHALLLAPVIHLVRYEVRSRRADALGPVTVRRFPVWRDVGIIAGATLVALSAHLIAVATWAWVFTLCGEFSQFPAALYHSGMNYTTLGDSANVMSPSWRLLASLEAANGMLMFGVTTALLFAIVLRLFQTRFKD
jgi:hypothetical protein